MHSLLLYFFENKNLLRFQLQVENLQAKQHLIRTDELIAYQFKLESI